MAWQSEAPRGTNSDSGGYTVPHSHRRIHSVDPPQTAGASQVLPAFQIALRGFFSGATALLLFEAK